MLEISADRYQLIISDESLTLEMISIRVLLKLSTFSGLFSALS